MSDLIITCALAVRGSFFLSQIHRYPLNNHSGVVVQVGQNGRDIFHCRHPAPKNQNTLSSCRIIEPQSQQCCGGWEGMFIFNAPASIVSMPGTYATLAV